MARLTKQQWDAARVKWEADPDATFRALGRDCGVTEAAVRQKAKAEGWTKFGSQKSINEAAQRKADEKLRADFAAEVQKSSIRELAEDIRAGVIERHRADWAEHRKHFTTTGIAADFEMGKSAKISAEMLSIRQKGERAAYGLDEVTGQDAIVIERSYGAGRG